jgi:UTP--glucose-1-phosphate uridylyltransferase
MELESAGKLKRLEEVRNILPSHVSAVFIRQPRPLGLGHAVACARRVVGDEPFAVLLADDLIDGGSQPCLSQMAQVFEDRGSSVLAVEEVDPADTDKYGIVKVRSMEGRIGEVERIVEKPVPSEAPSNLAVLGRYILTPRIFELLENTPRGAGGEIQLTDAIAMLLQEEKVLGYQFAGKRYDCGSKLGYLSATVEFALQHQELGAPFRDYLRKFCEEENL